MREIGKKKIQTFEKDYDYSENHVDGGSITRKRQSNISYQVPSKSTTGGMNFLFGKTSSSINSSIDIQDKKKSEKSKKKSTKQFPKSFNLSMSVKEEESKSFDDDNDEEIHDDFSIKGESSIERIEMEEMKSESKIPNWKMKIISNSDELKVEKKKLKLILKNYVKTLKKLLNYKNQMVHGINQKNY